MFLKLKKFKIIFITASFLFILFFILKKEEKIRKSLFFKLDEQGVKERIWMEVMDLKMANRKRKMEDNCRATKLDVRGNDSLHRPNEWEFFISRPYHLVWCNVFKAASTSWMYNFNVLAGYNEDVIQKYRHSLLELARKRYPRPTLESLESALNDSISFLIVRHPFERLLSAYRDKIQNAVPNSVHYNLGNHIILKYRKEINHRISKACIFRFLKKKPQRPTFSEFVDYLINYSSTGKTMNEHWIPITNFCTPCQVRFDVIMKFETLNDDQNYLIKKQNLQNKIKPQWKNPGKDRETSSSLTEKYYNQLNSAQIYKLFEIYRNDFYIFSYNLDEYFKFLDPVHIQEISNFFRNFSLSLNKNLN